MTTETTPPADKSNEAAAAMALSPPPQWTCGKCGKHNGVAQNRRVEFSVGGMNAMSLICTVEVCTDCNSVNVPFAVQSVGEMIPYIPMPTPEATADVEAPADAPDTPADAVSEAPAATEQPTVEEAATG